jgi:hypothetical protein
MSTFFENISNEGFAPYFGRRPWLIVFCIITIQTLVVLSLISADYAQPSNFSYDYLISGGIVGGIADVWDHFFHGILQFLILLHKFLHQYQQFG